jgi:hypothetical protein
LSVLRVGTKLREEEEYLQVNGNVKDLAHGVHVYLEQIAPV